MVQQPHHQRTLCWQVYYWCEATDEVLWEPPEGATPRTEAERDTAAEVAALPDAEVFHIDNTVAPRTATAAHGEGVAATAEALGSAASESLPAAVSQAEALSRSRCRRSGWPSS